LSKDSPVTQPDEIQDFEDDNFSSLDLDVVQFQDFYDQDEENDQQVTAEPRPVQTEKYVSTDFATNAEGVKTKIKRGRGRHRKSGNETTSVDNG